MRAVRIIVVVALLGALGGGAWRWSQGSLRALGRRPPPEQPVPVTAARLMDFETVLLATGTMEPGVRRYLVAPRGGSMRVEQIVPDGSTVKAGEVVIKLSTRETEEQVAETQDQLLKAKEGMGQARDNGARQVEAAQSALTAARERLDLTRAQNAADLERAQAELDRAREEKEYAAEQLAKMQRLFDQGLATRNQFDQEATNANEQVFAHDKNERALATARREAEEKERAAVTDIGRAELGLADAEAGRLRATTAARNQIDSLQRRLSEQEMQQRDATVKADIDGLVLIGLTWDMSGRHTIRVGDQMWSGFPMGQVIDPRRLRVTCEIDEIDMKRIRSGQQVRLRVGTARGRVFKGRLESVSNIASAADLWRGGSPGRKSFSAWVAVAGADASLKPGTTAWLEVVTDKVKGKPAVPVEAVFRRDGQPVIYRKRAGRFEEVPVKLGPRDDLYWAVLSGLRPRDEIALVRPRANLRFRKGGGS
ncbi:MAG TPA: efflux RND transporter periplasmic adaptor subunit [Armatimonadota bacterium]|nr:efflux RND transporter periplasmic adaptor subunit [Armatimonadota bacterium]